MLTCVGLHLHKDQKDDLLLTMAYRCFINRRYNKDILIYLRTHFEGRIFDFHDLWTVLKKEGLLTVQFEEKILRQIRFVGSKEERLFSVLLSYMEKDGDMELAESLLEEYSRECLMQNLNGSYENGKTVPEGYVDALGRLAGKECLSRVLNCLSYLYFKAERGYKETEKIKIHRLVRDFCRQGVVFPFFQRFAALLPVRQAFFHSARCAF